MTPLGASATVVPAVRAPRFAFGAASFIETLGVLAAIALLLPLFAQLTRHGVARDDRFDVPAALSQPACTAPACSASSGSSTQPTDRASMDARKNAAMRQLMSHAGEQWAGAMLLGLLMLKLSRTRLRPLWGASWAVAAWAAAAWAARVPWPFATTHGIEFARSELAWESTPSSHVLALFGAAALLALLGAAWTPRGRAAPQTLSTRVGYPGLVLATGLGWLLLLDLSARGHFGNRYLALYHQGHLWLAMLVFSVMLFLRQPLANAAAWTLSVIGELSRRLTRRSGLLPGTVLLVLSAAGLGAAIGIPLAHMRQLTSELGRLWIIVGAAWFFFLRGGPLAERLARSGAPLGSVLRYIAPLLFVALVLLALMLVTHDMGPLLIAGYGAGAFLAASLVAWWYQRSGHAGVAALLGMLLFAAWIALVTFSLFKLGAVDATTATRLESLAAPLASSNDQLALVQWFQHAAPPEGFGLGSVPWCGFVASGGCHGVPAQIHSDYTFTALVGAFGARTAWIVAIGCAFWLHRLVRHHARVTRGEPRLVRAQGRMGNDAQGFVSWIALAWVVLCLCQLAVTVAGNIAVLPLTGVTLPFVSFGMTSLVLNAAFLALSINLSLPEEARHG